MNKRLFLASLYLAFPITSLADPLHSRTGGEYWHHDSGWIFPEKIGAFTRVGVPQDVAGSRDAVAWYAYVDDAGARITASVDVFPVDSAADGVTLESARDSLRHEPGADAGNWQERELTLGQQPALPTTVISLAARKGAQTWMYFADGGGWRVRIRVNSPNQSAAVGQAGLDFAQAQRWETLGAH